MASLNDDVANIGHLQDLTQRLREQLEANGEELKTAMAEVRERVRAGESTGDRVRDFVLSRYGFSPQIEQTLRDIEVQLFDHVGELVLIVLREENFHGCTGFGGKAEDRDYHLEERWYLGVVSDVELIMDPTKPDLQLPTGGQHLTVRLSYPGQEKVEEDDIRLGHNLDPLYRLNQPLKLRNPMNRRIAIPLTDQELLQMELIVGSEAVEAWCEADGKASAERLLRVRGMIGAPATF